MATQRKIDEAAISEAAARLEGVVVPSLCRRVVEEYVAAQVRAELAKNAVVAGLARMKVGHIWAGYRRTSEPYAIQTVDKQRARLLMEEPGADWSATRRERWGDELVLIVQRIA